MQKKKYRGYFGLDFLIDKKNGKVYLSELNARLTASAAFYTRLERGLGIIPFLAYHYSSFLGIDLPHTGISPPICGSQIILREKKALKKLNLNKFGTYEIFRSSIRFLDTIYAPEKLRENQFVFHPEVHFKKSDELARIETKMKTLKIPGHLSVWINRLLS